MQVPHGFVHDLGATVADLYQQAADRVTVNARHALGGADAVSFEQGGDYGEFLFRCECVHLA